MWKCGKCGMGNLNQVRECAECGEEPSSASPAGSIAYRPNMFMADSILNALSDVKYRVEQYHPDEREQFIERLIEKLRNGDWQQ